jgi:mRNA interferase MazF
MVIVAALASGDHARYDVQVGVKAPEGGLRGSSLVLLNQIRTIDKRRVRRYWGRLSPHTMREVDRALCIGLGLVTI